MNNVLDIFSSLSFFPNTLMIILYFYHYLPLEKEGLETVISSDSSASCASQFSMREMAQTFMHDMSMHS